MNKGEAIQAYRPIVFVGPSVSRQDISLLLPQALVLPPIARNELYRARELGRSVFLIIDGVFSHQFAISPREIVDVVRDGALVIGASSMGALRAAECWPVGMQGSGLIYRLFRAGVLDSDDEVAVATNPDKDFCAMSVALINVRYAASKAVRMGLIDRTKASRMVQFAQALFFTERQWKAIFEKVGIQDGFIAASCTKADIKPKDAIAALTRLSKLTMHSETTSAYLRTSTGTLIPAARYPGHDRCLGLDETSLKQELMRWLFGIGRYQKFIWPLVISSPEFAKNGAAPLDGPAILRGQLANAIARLLQEPILLVERLWMELEFLDELDAELLRWHAIQEFAAKAREGGFEAFPIEIKRSREETAIAHGFRNWRQLSEDVSDGRLFDAIPINWVDDACNVLALARSFRTEMLAR